MNITGHNDHSDRLKVACDHYLDLAMSLQYADGERALWPCPSCGEASFAARFHEGVAGCTGEHCTVPHSMDLLELVAYLDEELNSADRKAANKRFSEIFEAVAGNQRQLEEERRERRQLYREQRRRKGSAKTREEKQNGPPEDPLF